MKTRKKKNMKTRKKKHKDKVHGRVTGWDVFLSLEPFSEVRQSSRLRSQVHMSKQLNSCQHYTQAESNEDMKTADKKIKLKEGQQKDNKLDVQLN